MLPKNIKYDWRKITPEYETPEDEYEVHRTEKLRGDFISEDDLLVKNTKRIVTIRIDEDVLKAIKQYAKKKKLKYQTLINDHLRLSFIKEGNNNSLLMKLMERVEHLEKMYLK